MMLPRFLLLLAAAVLPAGEAGAAFRHHPHHGVAAARPVTWTDYRDHPKGYLSKAELPDAYGFLPPPPAPDSPRGLADVATYRAMKALKDTPRWRQARSDADVESTRAPGGFTCVAGAEITPSATPTLSLLLARVMADVGQSEDHAKDAYARRRPFLADDGDTCIDKEAWLVKQGSYPSGHAATGWAWALVLAELEPERAGALLKRGMSFGESRIVCRVHFASDVEAGRLVGAAVVARLHRNPAFLADLKQARAELAKARMSSPSKGCGEAR